MPSEAIILEVPSTAPVHPRPEGGSHSRTGDSSFGTGAQRKTHLRYQHGYLYRASRDSVPVIRQLALILDEYRRSIGSPQVGFVFPSSDGLPINLGGFTRKVIQPNLAANRLPWYG